MRIISLSTIIQASKNRLPGYKEEIISIAKSLGNGKYELTKEQWEYISLKFRPKKEIGLGTLTKSIIHTAIDLAPISKNYKSKIKKCGKCAKREERLNKIIPNINPFG